MQVPIANLVDAVALAALVNSYIDHHRPLPQPYQLPPTVQSPATTLAARGGNCLETALLLCSLLLGQGRDAFVVVGYAPPAIVGNVQSGQRCPASAVQRRLAVQRLVQEFLKSCEDIQRTNTLPPSQVQQWPCSSALL